MCSIFHRGGKPEKIFGENKFKLFSSFPAPRTNTRSHKQTQKESNNHQPIQLKCFVAVIDSLRNLNLFSLFRWAFFLVTNSQHERSSFSMLLQMGFYGQPSASKSWLLIKACKSFAFDSLFAEFFTMTKTRKSLTRNERKIMKSIRWLDDVLWSVEGLRLILLLIVNRERIFFRGFLSDYFAFIRP